MVGHPRPNNDWFRFSLGGACRLSIVPTLVKSVFADPTHVSNLIQIGQRGFSLERQPQKAGIRRNDRTVISGWGKSQSRNAKGVVFVMAILVPVAIGGLRNSPGYMERTDVSALSFDCGAQRGIKHSVAVGAHP